MPRETALDHSRGNTDCNAIIGDEAVNNSTSTYGTAISDVSTWQQRSSSSDPTRSAYDDGSSVHHALQTLLDVRRMVSRDEVYVWCNYHVVSNRDEAAVVEGEAKQGVRRGWLNGLRCSLT